MFHSWNAFIDKLGCDFDILHMLVVDLLHEFELGVWKALFTHLIQILHAAALHSCLVAKLDRTYVSCTVSYQELINFSVTTNQVLGHANIWLKHIATNASEMKKLAAHDFEDLSQA